MHSAISGSPEGQSHGARSPRLIETDIRPWLALSSVLSLVCLLVIPFPLGFDPSAWVTWATAIGHGNSIKFVVEPGWKPLPVLVMAPFAAVSVNLAAAVWMFIVRFCAFLIPVLIFRLVQPTFGTKAAVLSAISPLAIPVLWALSADGHSEAVVTACALAAAGLIRSGRRRAAIALATAVSLMRPEAILILALFGVWFMYKRDWETVVALLIAALVFGVAWFAIPLFVAGDAFNTFGTSHHLPPFRKGLTPLQNLTMPTSHVIWPPRLLIAPFIVAGLIALRRKRDRPIEVLVVSAAVFTTIAAATLASGSAGDPRYFLAVSISACCLVGPGAMLMIEMIPSAKACTAAFAAVACLLIASFPLPGFPLSSGGVKIPNIETAESLDAGAQALRFAVTNRNNLDCPAVAIAIAIDYESWPQLAARTGHPMSDFNYIATAPAITVEQSAFGTPADRQSPQLTIHGDTNQPQVLAQFPAGNKTWTVKYSRGQSQCRPQSNLLQHKP